MVHHLIVKIVFQRRLCVSQDEDARRGPLPPDELSGGPKSQFSQAVIQNCKTESYFATQTKDFAIAAGWCNGVVESG
jgi:hypothetical protein